MQNLAVKALANINAAEKAQQAAQQSKQQQTSYSSSQEAAYQQRIAQVHEMTMLHASNTFPKTN